MGKENKNKKTYHFYGRVQGVGFRYYAVQKANQLGLTGWVKNLYDGSVEMEVEGQEELIDQLIIFCRTGHISGSSGSMRKKFHCSRIVLFAKYINPEEVS